MSKFIWDYDKRITVLALYKEDAEALKPYLEKMVKQAEKKAEHYRDILEGGEATERQQSALANAETAIETLGALLNNVNMMLESDASEARKSKE